MKRVQIPESLLAQMCHYMLIGNGSQDRSEAAESLRRALSDKMDAMSRRSAYTAYKTAQSEQEREKAREEYLNKAGIPDDYRW